ncbi:MAG TPA: hypothetical protein VH208_04660 [Myxococcaceae bacterium]|nr:hypothetical protein [Myxococcaceae bacterium]
MRLAFPNGNGLFLTACYALVLLGCASGGGMGALNAGSAALNTGIAGGAAAYSRAHGGCYASCPVGTACNTQTGMCDELPCRGQCAYDEECDSSGLFPRCVRSTKSPLEIHAAPDARPPPPPPQSSPSL